VGITEELLGRLQDAQARINVLEAERAVAVKALEAAHSVMDDDNAAITMGAYCRWCHEKGYDGDGLIHNADCILMEIRALLSRLQSETAEETNAK
jgi:hypothetical protein